MPVPLPKSLQKTQTVAWGKIRNASQGQFSISDRDANTPYIKSIRVVTTVNYYLRR